MSIKIPQNVINLKQTFKKESSCGLALDIDETLSWTVGYWMEKMCKRFGNPENLSIQELVKKYRYANNVPYWHTNEGRAWIEKTRHMDSLQVKISLIENSNNVVQKVNSLIPIMAYITTRPESVINGTKKWLEKHKFPKATVIAKPLDIPYLEGNKWKAQVLQYLYPEIIGIIDDNAELIDHLPENYPGIVFLYDNDDHPRKGANIHPCPTWDDVLVKVKSQRRS